MPTEILAIAEVQREKLEVADAFAEHYPAVYRQVQRLIGDPDDSYDLTITAWEKAQRAWERRPAIAVEVKPWLFRIARNACVDELRRRQLIRWEPLEGRRRGPTDDEDRSYLSPAALLRSSDFEPEHEALREERMALVRKALLRLPGRYRTALMLRETSGLSCEEIGVQLHMSPGAVRTTLCRARQRLKVEYLALGGEPLAA